MKCLTAGTLIAISSSLNASTKASASPNYQEIKGIFAEVKYAEVCNYLGAYRWMVIAEAGSRDNHVQSVEFKMFSRRVGGGVIGSFPLGIPFGANWLNIGTRDNTSGGDRRFYKVGPTYQTGMSLDPSTSVKFAIHVNTPHGKVIDLGRIVDLGTIPGGTCRVYDDGTIR